MHANEPELSENQVKAAYLYNFMKNTHWPKESAIKEFNVVFLGSEESFYNDFLTIAEKINIRGKKIRASKINTAANIKKQHVLVVSPLFNYKLKDIETSLMRSGTLIISDGVADKKIVMINYTYPKKSRVSFEINKSNIVYEGLAISNDVLLHGGTEIEVATLYKEMEFLLQDIIKQVEKNKTDLNAKISEINKKNSEILNLQEQTSTYTQQLATQSAQIQKEKENLLSLSNELNETKTALESNNMLLDSQKKLVSDLEIEITRNENTLQRQLREISDQHKLIDKKTETVNSQDATITSQRNIIVMALIILLAFLLIIINRQKQALTRQRQLVEAKAELIHAQNASIKAFESSIKLKNDFLAAISHEMRTPMNGIIGAVQIADSNDFASLLSAMDIITQSSHDMITLVDDILSYIEIQSEQVNITQEPIAAQNFFETLHQKYKPKCEQKQLALHWHVSDKLPQWILLDKNKYAKILQTLLDNALKFTHKGAITVIIRHEKTDTNNQLICTIKDTGTGIPKEAQAHIFDAFWQQDSGLTRQFGGLGIGLSICQKLVQILDGTLEMNSSKEQGTFFNITIEAPESNAPSITHTPSTAAFEKETHSILVVEDNTINQQVLVMMLKKLNYLTYIANDGIEALDVIEHITPALILMDLQMPNMDGFACTQKIRARLDAKKDIPIIAITANSMESQQNHCMQVGMNLCLSKPIELTVLKKAVEQFLITGH
jgi:signal transduction histidine kinase/CheY-like chemotaxis protein